MDTKDLLIEVGNNIKRIREEKGILQHDLAAMCDYDKSNMSFIESGTRNITLKTLNKIAAALKVTPRDLLP